jgi:hypothetical protein
MSGHDHVRRAHDPTPTQAWHFGAPLTFGRSKPLPWRAETRPALPSTRLAGARGRTRSKAFALAQCLAKALRSRSWEQAPGSVSVVPPGPTGRSPGGPETRRRMDEVASVCTIRRRSRLRSGGRNLPLPRTLDPPDAPKHEAWFCRKADPAERSRCPRRRVFDHMRPVAEANLHDR